MKNFYFFILALMLSSFVYGQPYYPTIYPSVTPDKYDPNSQETNVVNTGNDILQGETLGFETHVTVCDGTNPHFVWWDTNTGGDHYTIDIEDDGETNATIIDPDVVLMESYDFNLSDLYFALIVYETENGEIYLLVKYYEPLTINWYFWDRIFIGYGHNPNIDATTNEQSGNNGDDNFVITWENDGYINAYAANFINAQITNGSGEVRIYDPNDHNDKGAITPDVTVSYTSSNPVYIVSFTFTADMQLWLDQEDFDEVLNNNITTPNLDFVFDLSNTTNFGRPRIASPDIEQGGAAYDIDDVEIVIDADPDQGLGMNTMIWGFNRHFGTQSNYNYEYTSDPDWIESLPVVCYSGDRIFVSWVLLTIQASSEVIQINCGHDGSWPSGYYSQVNEEPKGKQSIPSISAFYYNNYVYYSFMDFEVDHIRSKTSLATNVQLKGTETIIDIYPNPAHERLSVDAGGTGEITLTDNTGRTVLTGKTTNGSCDLNTTGLSPGIYFLKYAGDNTFSSQKVIIQ